MALLILLAVALAGWRWLQDHPQHNPWAPLSLDDPPGWATARKLVSLRDNPGMCKAALERSGIAFTELPPAGEGACRRDDRTVLGDDVSRGFALRPAGAAATCAVNAGMLLWLAQGVQPAARVHLGSLVARIEHYGTNSCRRIGGGGSSGWSEHATGNAIDIAAFVLADGRRISVRESWLAGDDKAAFLHAARDQACGVFGTVLSPAYNAAHDDHFHLDQADGRRGWSYCR